jgi:hypothetical protein
VLNSHSHTTVPSTAGPSSSHAYSSSASSTSGSSTSSSSGSGGFGASSGHGQAGSGGSAAGSGSASSGGGAGGSAGKKRPSRHMIWYREVRPLALFLYTPSHALRLQRTTRWKRLDSANHAKKSADDGFFVSALPDRPSDVTSHSNRNRCLFCEFGVPLSPGCRCVGVGFAIGAMMDGVC